MPPTQCTDPLPQTLISPGMLTTSRTVWRQVVGRRRKRQQTGARKFILNKPLIKAARCSRSREPQWGNRQFGDSYQLQAVRMVPLQLPHLSDPRAVRLAEILMTDPSDAKTLTQLCGMASASKRSIERLFQQEIGMTFGKWRRQLRLMQGLRLLADGAKLTHGALESGYSTRSAFIAMFRRVLGTTPTAYFRLR